MQKYRAKKTTIDDIMFDSKLEAEFYLYLKHSQDIILHKLQVPVELLPKLGKVRAVKYVADFLVEYKGKQYLIDAKGVETPVFKLKLKLYAHLQDTLPLIVAKTIQEMINKLNLI